MASSSSSSYRSLFGGEWTLLSTRMPGGARYGFAFASLNEDRHFLLGGAGANGRTQIVEEYNSTTQTFEKHPPLGETRFLSAATAIDNWWLLVTGGSMTLDGSCHVYDTTGNKGSTDVSPLGIVRVKHACVCTNNKVYAIGGGNPHFNGNESNLDIVEVLDLPPNRGWNLLPQRLSKRRSGCCAVVHPKNPNIIIVVGGYNDNDKYLSCCETIALEQGQTVTLPSLMTPRAYHMLALVENRFVVAMGGYDGSQVVSSVEYLDLEEATQQQQWRPLPSMNAARSFFAAFYSPRNQRIVVAGGFDGANVMDTVEELPVLFRGHANSSN